MATTGPNQLPAFFNTDADFRAWAQGVHDALAACGMVNTADTGQINLTTVVKPAGANTFQGYEIWRFNDALQGTVPVYLKVEYGSGAAADRPSLRLQVGSGSNGSGTLTGQLGNQRQSSAASSKVAGNTLPLYASGDGGRIALVTNLDNASNNFGLGFVIDRGRDSSGTATVDGVATYMWGGGITSNQYQAVPGTGTVPGTQQCPYSNPGVQGVSKVGVEVGLAAHPVWFGKALAEVAAVSYVHADIGELATFQATLLGATHTFMPLGDGVGSGNASWSTNAACSLAFLWE